MIQPQTVLQVADNSGAKKLMCIRVLRSRKKYAKVGDVIIGVVKQALPNMNTKKSEVVRAIVVRTKKTLQRKDGSCIRFGDNAAVLVNKDNNPIGTRVFGPVPSELRTADFTKLISLASEIV